MANRLLDDVLSELYPQCMSLRKELDALLAAISTPSTPQAASVSAGEWGSANTGGILTTTARMPFSETGARNSTYTPVAKLQRFSALTRQFCMLVLRLQDAFVHGKNTQVPRRTHALWERRIQDMLADAESFRREAEGRMNLEQQRVEDAMRERKALLGESNSNRRWGDIHNAELMYAKERDRLQESRTMLDSVLSQGWGIVGQLVSQNAALKNAKRKVLDIASSAGVASTLLGAVGRRRDGDKWLVYGGMVVTLLFFFVAYRLVHYGSIFGFLSTMADSEEATSFSEADKAG